MNEKETLSEKNSVSDSLISHLVELRSCVFRSVLALLGAMILILPVAGQLFNWLAKPLIEELTGNSNLISISVLGPFIIQITTSFFFAIWLTLPYILYQSWRFISPGLYKNEKGFILPIITSSVILFSLGMAFAYFIVFKVVFGFIAGVAPEGVEWTPDVGEYFSFIVKIFLGFGLAFETPVVVLMLVRSGMVELQALKDARPYVIVGAFVVAAIITPPDVISQILLAVPCWLLYEVGLFLAPKQSKKKAEAKTLSQDD